MSKIKVALIGAGNIANVHLEIMKILDAIYLSAKTGHEVIL